MDAIDWASLHGSYRSAEDVPGRLRALRSPDRAERRDALIRFDAYHRWLTDADPEIAARAAELLAWFTADQATIAALLGADREDGVRASANLALAHLPLSPDVLAERMTSLLEHDSDLVRMTAAIALAYRVGEGLPERALDILVTAKESEALPEFPRPWRRAQRGYVALALQRLGLG